MQLLPTLLVFGGGGLGAVARYLTAGALSRLPGMASFPLGTLAVNLVGAFAIGLLTGLAFDKLPMGEKMGGKMGENLRLLLVTGFLGGFTTFSAYSLETAKMWQSGDLIQAALYTALSVLGTVILVFAGLLLARLLQGQA